MERWQREEAASRPAPRSRCGFGALLKGDLAPTGTTLMTIGEGRNKDEKVD